MTTHPTATPRLAPPALPGSTAIAAGGALGALAGIAAAAGTSAIATGLVVGAAAVSAGLADLRERRIPNLVVIAMLVAATLVTVAVAVVGDRPVLLSTLGGAALGGGLLLVLHLLRPSGLGFGDVKLAGALGATLGVVHWTLAAVALGLASLLGALGAALIPSWRRSIPFGACLGAAAVATLATAGWWRTSAGLW